MWLGSLRFWSQKAILIILEKLKMSNQSFELEATVREDLGKGASRRLRRLNDLVPGIVYGNNKPSIPLSLEHRVLVKALENEAIYSSILELIVDGKKEKVVLKDLHRHPFKPKLQHIDFQRVSATHKITMHVPIHFENEELAPGLKAGGVFSHHMTEVEVRCLAKDLPEFIAIDLSETQLDTVVHVSDLKVSEQVELTAISHGHDNDQPVVSLHMPRRSADVTASADADGSESTEEGSTEGS